MAMAANGTDTEIDVDNVIALTSCCLSIIGGFFILFTFCSVRNLNQSTPRKILVNITFADIMLCTFYIMGALRSLDASSNPATESVMCKVQSFMTTYASISMFFWTDILAFYLFAVVKFKTQTDLSCRQKLAMYVVGWILPGIILIPPSAMDVLGDDSHTSGPWCWIKTKDNSSNIVWLFLAGKAYEIGTYLIVVILYIWMKIIIRKASKENNSWIRGRRGIRQEDEKFWLTWIVMLVLRLPGTLRTFISISDPKSGFNIFLMYLQSFGDPGQAFINCIIYCFLDRDVQDYMKEVLLEYKNGLCNSYEIIEDSSQPLK